MKKKNWKWFGAPGHFICSSDCRFHLCTQIGRYLISTVGEYFPDYQVREIYAESRGVKLEGIGDERRADYMRKIGFETIGYNRLYETMVFLAGKPCSRKGCDCQLPELASSELDFAPYNDQKSATEGHMRLCQKYARKK